MWLPSTKSISMMLLRMSVSSGVSFSMTMPLPTTMVQALIGLPLTLTVQTRQWPPGVRSLW